MSKHLLPVLLLSGSLLSADTLVLRDGRTVDGTFISGNRTSIRFTPRGSTSKLYRVTTVDQVIFGSGAQQNAGSRAPSQPYGASRARVDERVNYRYTVPAGTVVTVRMIDEIDSNETDVNRAYRASLDDHIVVDGRTIAPRGADATVKVVRVDQSGTISGREEVAVVLAEVMSGGQRYVIDSTPAELSAKSRSQESVKVIGGTAVVGAIIGAIAGGGKGAAIGAASGAGAGAAVQAIRGQRVKIPSETRLDFTLAQPLRIS